MLSIVTNCTGEVYEAVVVTVRSVGFYVSPAMGTESLADGGAVCGLLLLTGMLVNEGCLLQAI